MTEPGSRPAPNPKDDAELDDFEKELDTYIENEEKSSTKESKTDLSRTGVTDQETERPEKGQAETQGTDREKKTAVSDNGPSDNEDSEPDDYNITDDQRRALEELDNLKYDMRFPDEEPPEYNVKERLKTLNQELADDPTPLEKQGGSKVVFKPDLVSLVAPPPPDFSDEEEDKATKTGKPSPKTTPAKTDEKPSEGKKEKVLIEREGHFELVNADDVTARDLGLASFKDSESKTDDSKTPTQRTPVPPGKPRPATANGTTRRNVRTTPAKQRPQSASASQSARGEFDYSSPYAMSPKEKELAEMRKKTLDKKKREEDRRSKIENEDKQKENDEAFNYWLKKKREEDRRKKIVEEEERKKSDKEDRDTDSRSRYSDNKPNSTDEPYYTNSHADEGDTASERSESEEAFKAWLKEKHTQFKKEKLLKRRQDQEMHEGYYVRSRDECDKAYKEWLKHKAVETRKARAMDRQKARMHRLAARRTRKSQTLARAVRQSQAFRYVDYYGYRF